MYRLHDKSAGNKNKINCRKSIFFKFLSLKYAKFANKHFILIIGMN